MAYKVKTIPLKNITKIQLYLNTGRKTLDKVMKETGARYGINGTLYDGWTPCENVKVDGKVINKKDWSNPGMGWTTGRDIFVNYFPSGANGCTNYFSGNEIISPDGTLVKDLNWGSQLAGARGRTAMGIDKKGNLVIYSCLDGVNALTPAKLQAKMASLGCYKGAINLDGGTSVAWYDTDAKKYQKPGKGYVQNYILFWFDDEPVKEQKPVTPTTDTKVPTPTTPATDTGSRRTLKDFSSKLHQNLITKNPCYTKQIKCNKKKFMLHSTATPGAMRGAFRAAMDSASANTAVEFIADYDGIDQLLPIGVKSWHAGASANNTHVSLEMCEPPDCRVIDIEWYPQYKGQTKNVIPWAIKRIQQELVAWGYDPKGVDGKFGPGCDAAVRQFQKDQGLTADGSVGPGTLKAFRKRKGSLMQYDPNTEENQKWFNGTYENAVLTAANFLTSVGGNPLTDIVCHCEGYAMGIASNHADVMHWFVYHGKTMDDFRRDVKVVMEGGSICGATTYPKGSDMPEVEEKPDYAQNIQVLVKHGIITSPDYWLGRESDANIPFLIAKMADHLRTCK